jgi:hypothetical protein
MIKQKTRECRDGDNRQESLTLVKIKLVIVSRGISPVGAIISQLGEDSRPEDAMLFQVLLDFVRLPFVRVFCRQNPVSLLDAPLEGLIGTVDGVSEGGIVNVILPSGQMSECCDYVQKHSSKPRHAVLFAQSLNLVAKRIY